MNLIGYIIVCYLLIVNSYPSVHIARHVLTWCNIIKQYISVTDPPRDTSESKLLIRFRKPHRAVSKDAVARWVKSALANADIHVTNFATHSTRAASTSYSVNKAGLNLAQALKTAGWANGSTFAKFYNKLPQNDNCGSVILESYSRNETHNPSN